MIEISRQRLVPFRIKIGGKLSVKLGPDGQPETKLVSSDVWRQTRSELGGQHGRDKHRKLVVGLVGPDQLAMYPKGTRQEVRVNLVDIYTWALRNRAMRTQLEKARERKEKKAETRARRQIADADRRLRAKLKAERATLQ